MHDGEHSNLPWPDGIDYRIRKTMSKAPVYRFQKDRSRFRNLGDGLNTASNFCKERFSEPRSGSVVVGGGLVQLNFRQLNES
jgi:hypothetical protein